MATYRDIKPELTITPQQLPKVANPAPLGLAGFGLTTVLLSCVNAGVIPANGAMAVVPMTFAFGGLAQIIAGILEYVNGNTFGMVAFTSYGTLLVVVCVTWCGRLAQGPAQGTGTIRGRARAGLWGVFTLYMWISTFPREQGSLDGVPSIVDHLLPALRRRLRRRSRRKRLAVTFGILTGIAALYVSFAEVTNGAFGRTVIPLGGPFCEGEIDRLTEAPGLHSCNTKPSPRRRERDMHRNRVGGG